MQVPKDFLLGLWAIQLWLITLAICSSNLTDHSSLLAFMSSIKYDPNNVKSNWTSTPDFCNWIGVSCSPRRQRVTALRLRNLSLAGTISPHIGNLSFLADLNLHNNSFHGNVVNELGRLKRLRRLSLGHNNLEGKIPGSLQNCRKLERIYLTDNNFIGSIPEELTTLPSLQILFLGVNNLSGTIPASLGNISSLEAFGLENNNVVGSIPRGIAQIPGLRGVNIFGNYLSGLIPLELFNMSTLQQVLLTDNNLSGTLPKTTGFRLPNLEMFDLTTNQLTGEIPLYLTNASKLNELSLSDNRFSGPVRLNFGHLTLLQIFGITDNHLTVEPGSVELSFLTSMTNCSSLQYLLIDRNPWGGFLPNSIGNLSSTVQRFGASSCQLQGSIPRGIGYLKVNMLELSDNNLQGTIPSTIGNMERLQRLYLDGNKFEGSIPDEICLLSNLGEMYLQSNKLSGPIPSCIGNLSHLQLLSLYSNKLNSSIPLSLWRLQGLSFLNLSSNLFSGTLVMESSLKSLEGIDLSRNKISGPIPSTIGAFQSLLLLNLSRNSLSEHIPESFSSLITLGALDLSHNNISGEIPRSLERLSHLKFLNLSFNNFSGEIPRQGPFKNFTALSFLENAALCGMTDLDVPSCVSHRSHKNWIDVVAKFILPSIASVTILVVALVYFMKRRQQIIVQANSETPAKEHRRFTYQELCRATNDFCDANLLGVGSYGSVYKAVLPDGEIVAGFKSYSSSIHAQRKC